MKNIYINKFKAIAENYFNDVSALREKAKYNSVTYNQQVAKDYNEKIESEITDKGNQAISEINSVFNELKAKISIRNFICTENFSSNIAVFESGIINQEEFNILLQKYYNDYAFVSVRRLVSAYPELAKSTGTIKTASDYVSAYRDFARGFSQISSYNIAIFYRWFLVIVRSGRQVCPCAGPSCCTPSQRALSAFIIVHPCRVIKGIPPSMIPDPCLQDWFPI